MARIQIKPVIGARDEDGVRATVEEFGLSVSWWTLEESLRHLMSATLEHAKRVVTNPHMDVTPDMRKLASDILWYGFVFADIEFDHQKLAEELEKIPHLESDDGKRLPGGPMLRAWIVQEHRPGPFRVERCAALGGRCAHYKTIQRLKVTATTTTPTT